MAASRSWGGGTRVYHDNIWLPPEVAAAVRGANFDALYLRHSFHLLDPHRMETMVPAVLKVVFGPPEEACGAPGRH